MAQEVERTETAAPFISVNDDKGVRVALGSLSKTQLEERRDELEKTFSRAYDEAGPNVDLSKVTVVTAATDQDKMAKLKEMHTEIAAIVDEISAKDKLSAWNREIAERSINPSSSARPTDSNEGAERPSNSAGFNGEGFVNQLFGEFGSEEFESKTSKLMDAWGNNSVAFNSREKDWAPEMVGTNVDILNTLFQRGTGAGQAPTTDVPRPGYFVGGITPPPDLVDVIRQVAWNQGSYTFLREADVAIGDIKAAPRAEGAEYPEMVAKLAKVVVPMEVVAGYLPVTDEVMEDIQGLMNWVSGRVGYRVRQALNNQMMVGTGTSPSLVGLLSTTKTVGLNLNVTQATKTGSAGSTKLANTYRSFGQCITDCRESGFASPDLVFSNPSVWFDAISEAAGSADKSFIVNSPANQDGILFRCWGRPLIENNDLSKVTTAADPGNTIGLVGKFADNVALYVRRQMQTTWGFINDDFIKGRNACKATVRVALAVEQPGNLRKLNVFKG